MTHGQWGTWAMGQRGVLVNTEDRDEGLWGMGHMGNGHMGRAHGEHVLDHVQLP